MTINESSIHPRGSRVLVRKYTKPPETPGGIIIPESVAADTTLSLWEVVRAGPKTEEVLGVKLSEDDIVQTNPMRGVPINDTLFMLEASEIKGVIAY